jgi:hypothetical protein
MQEKIKEWRNIRQELPKINQLVDVKFNHQWLHDTFIEKAKFSVSNEGFIGFLNSKGLLYDIDRISGWRPIPEKRPDFSKLKEGDLIYIDLNYANIEYIQNAHFFLRMDEDEIRTLVFHKSCHGKGCSLCHSGIGISGIKKITRINIEEKTFEEI